MISIPLISVSHADTDWQTISVNSPIDNKTKYLFYYSGDVEHVFVNYHPPLFYPNLVLNTTQYTNEIQIKIPRFFPTDSSYAWFLLMDSAEQQIDSDMYEESKCFCTYTINIENSTVVELLAGAAPPTQPHHIVNHPTPDHCLPHTIEDYPDTLDTYENIRGEQVRVYLSSVLELLERGYLVPVVDDVEPIKCSLPW